ncbi:SDR family NAD(P)-dependent oxidoreductase, partial [Streptomyces deserti]
MTLETLESRSHADLSGKRALVTGAARGLGAAIARRLAQAGASVCLTDVRREDGEKVC